VADTIIPASVTVRQGSAQRFAVPVSWSIDQPDGGSIDSASGLYQAPAAVPANREVAIVANDANGREIGRASVSLVTTAAPPLAEGSTTGVVRPPTVALGPGQRQQFSLPVTWGLDPTDGPGSINGQTGDYSAPCKVSVVKSFCVVAKDSNGTILGRANTTVTPPPPPVLALVVSPATADVSDGQQQAFSVAPGDQGVLWQDPSLGGISSTGVYTAPKSIKFSQTVVLTATSPDGARFGTATVRLSDGAYWARWLGWFWLVVIAVLGGFLFLLWPEILAPKPGPLVLVSPREITVNVTTGSTVAFTADVSGIADESKRSVAWSSSGPGTIDAVTGIYVTGDGSDGDVQVTAISKEDSSRGNTALLHRTKDVSLAVFPSSRNVGTSEIVKFIAKETPSASPAPSPRDGRTTPPSGGGGSSPPTGGGAPATPAPAAQEPVKWSIAPSDRGTVTQDGTYTAPPSIAQTEVITIVAERGKAKAAANVVLQGPKLQPGHLLLLAVLMGALGSALHAVVSLTNFVGSQQFVSAWFWWYIFRPFAGAALALFFYFLISVGKIAGASLDPASVALLCGMVGLFADKASGKLAEVFDALIGPKTDVRTDKLVPTTQSSSPPSKAPAIVAVTAATPITVGSNPVVTVTGTDFRPGATVMVKSVSHAASKVTPTSLEVQLGQDDTKLAGDLEIIVVNMDGTRSNPKMLRVA
jgi:hypothetical protein